MKQLRISKMPAITVMFGVGCQYLWSIIWTLFQKEFLKKWPNSNLINKSLFQMQTYYFRDVWKPASARKLVTQAYIENTCFIVIHQCKCFMCLKL